eukprot:TRINITY_DN2398_c0_g1_i3.p1 TRINITY_DN2398_c0_g1~~TRINITY_DN2398_c0_g1_i3.p1  ORF type:complete len:771 (-),score=203.69 TRINITY_DN2398_c0_g1_i3:130-2235(-)
MEEELEESSDDSLSKKSRSKKKKPDVVPIESSDDDEIKTTKPNLDRDKIISAYADVRRRESSDGEEVVVTFKRNSAALRNAVQMICQNPTTRQGIYISKVSFDDLFYARTFLQSMLDYKHPNMQRGLADLTLEEEEAEVPDLGRVEQRLKQAQGVLRLQEMGTYMPQGNPIAGLAELVEWINTEAKERIGLAEKLIAKNQVSFDGLSLVFKPGCTVVGRTNDTGASWVAYKVIDRKYHAVRTLTGKMRWFSINLEFVAAAGSDSFLFVGYSEMINNFLGAKPLNSLHIQVADPALEKILTQRGRKCVQLASGHHYMSYGLDNFSLHLEARNANQNLRRAQHNENISVSSFLRAKGRVMVDVDTGRRLGHFASEKSPQGYAMTAAINQLQQIKSQQQMHHHNMLYYGQQQQNNTEMKEVPEEFLCICWPAMTGFSFTAKTWGHVLVEGLDPIQFNDQAFHQLVLSPERKQLIHAMVKHSEGVFSDIIQGKGGGSIFLLHGPPGVGKTLTAEAVAEMLHRPMYSVTMGELGTTANELETHLRDILELATIWNAIVLMDEADIFLERRGHKEIVRNAMVGVLMRLIEYFQGVLFLTSNRVDVFDEAFHSRVTVALKYEALSKEVREDVWKMLFAASKISGIDTKKLATFPLNGRQIKNCICLAQGLAKADETAVTSDHIDRTIKVCMEFVEEMAGKVTMAAAMK